MAWKIEIGDDRVRGEVEAFPADVLARFRRIAELIQAHGPEHLHERHVKRLDALNWEIRILGRNGLVYKVFFSLSGSDIVIDRACVE